MISHSHQEHGTHSGVSNSRSASNPPSQQLQQLQQLFSNQGTSSSSHHPNLPGSYISTLSNTNLETSLKPGQQPGIFYPPLNSNNSSHGTSSGAGPPNISGRNEMKSTAVGKFGMKLPSATQQQYSRMQPRSDFARQSRFSDAPGPISTDYALDNSSTHSPSVQNVSSSNIVYNPSSNKHITGSSRLAIFIDRPVNNFCLIEQDLEYLLRAYSEVLSIRILNNAAAAEIVLADAKGAEEAQMDLMRIHVPEVGDIACVLLRPEETLERILPHTCYNPTILPLPEKDGIIQSGSLSGMGSVIKHHDYTIPTDNASSHVGESFDSSLKQSTTHISENEKNLHQGRFACRLEMIDLFGYEPDFDVTKALLGPDNSHFAYILERTNHKIKLGVTGKALNNVPIVERLHIMISSDDLNAYNQGLEMTEDLLQSVCQEFVEFCQLNQLTIPEKVGFRRHEYEQGPDGTLEYRGVKERPRTWLDQVLQHRTNYTAHANSNLIMNNVSLPSMRGRSRSPSHHGGRSSRSNERDRHGIRELRNHREIRDMREQRDVRDARDSRADLRNLRNPRDLRDMRGTARESRRGQERGSSLNFKMDSPRTNQNSFSAAPQIVDMRMSHRGENEGAHRSEVWNSNPITNSERSGAERPSSRNGGLERNSSGNREYVVPTWPPRIYGDRS